MTDPPSTAQTLKSNTFVARNVNIRHDAHQNQINIHQNQINISHDVQQNQKTFPRRDPMEIFHENVTFGALHNSKERVDPPRCHPHTRIRVIDRIERWAGDLSPNAKPILWLDGPAGAGKSAISRTLVERWKDRNVVVAAFFFWRVSPMCNQNTGLVPTIAFQLLELFPSIETKISAAISTGGLFERNLAFQLDKLVIEPLRELGIPQGQHPVVIIIDGLDECCIDLPGQNHESQQHEILELFGSACQKQRQPYLRLFITSRPERQIRNSFMTDFLDRHTVYVPLKNVEDASADIHLFLESKFHEIRQQHGIQTSWPTPAQLSELVRRSSGQFIYPSMAIKHLTRTRANPIHRLTAVLESKVSQLETNDNPFEELDTLYTIVLQSVARKSLSAVADIIGYILQDYQETIYQEVSNIFSPKPPEKSLAMFERFLFLSEGEASSHLTDLHSVIDIPPPNTQCAVSFIHATFAEYLQDESRSGNFFISREWFVVRFTKLLFRHLQNRDQYPGGQMYDIKWLIQCICSWIHGCPPSKGVMAHVWALMNAELGRFLFASGWREDDTLPLPSKSLSIRFISQLKEIDVFYGYVYIRQLLEYLQRCNISEIEPSRWRRAFIGLRLKAAISKYRNPMIRYT